MKVRFSSRGADFQQVVKARVDAYFDERALSKNGDLHMALKAVFWLGSSAALYAFVMIAQPPAWLALPCVMTLGFTLACVGFNVGHDAIHGATSRRPWVNALMSWSFQGIGAAAYTWSVSHNIVHHTYTNMPGHDDDLEPGAVMRFHPYSKRRALHPYQHLYAWGLYCLTTLNWVWKKDFAQILRWTGVEDKIGKPPTTRNKVDVVVSKLFHGALFIALPMYVLPYSLLQFAVGYVLMHFVAGITLAVVFQLAHVVEGIAMPPAPADGAMDDAWAAHQMRTTANFARGNRLVQFICGGLNYQVEHHLFPRICHVHYPAIAPIVMATAREFGLPYHEAPTFWGAVASHYRMLKAMGSAPQVVPMPLREQVRAAA